MSGTLDMGHERHPDPGQASQVDQPATGLPRPRTYFLSLIPLGSLHCPLPPFRVFPIAALFYSTSHSFTVFFNFAFLCSIYWELALIYFKPGCRSQTSSILYFCIVRLITLISAANAHTNSVILTHILIARHRCPISFHTVHCRNFTHSFTFWAVV